MLKYLPVLIILALTVLALSIAAVGCNESSGSGNETSGNDTIEPQTWTARYDGGIADDDGAWAMAVDSSENVYITGYSWGKGTSSDFATVKYGSDGKQLWLDRYDGPASQEDWPWDIALDASGNAFVTGWSTGVDTKSDFTTIKYDNKGKRIREARYNGPANGYDHAYALGLDSSGNVYVTGWCQGVATNEDYATIKYDNNLNQLWVARYSGPASGQDRASAIAVDGGGYVYVTGWSTNSGSGLDFTTVKYDSNGNQLWVARYDGLAGGEDKASAIALDSSGYIYVTGSSTGNGTGLDYATVKYDSKGVQIWATRYNGTANDADEAVALALDSDGSVYVTGSSMGIDTYQDYATVKYDGSGNQLWVARYNGPESSEDTPSKIAVNGSGNIYVTGWSTGNNQRYDYATIKYDSSGNEIWLVRFDGPAGGHDKAYDMVLGSLGGIYVTGRSSGKGTYYDFTTIKY
ncbi:MAG: hypothetical protein FJ004_07305 [Chloroflexi bacterium]|nr:hypothetical protein [Chloroflexota bacterium]